GAREGGRGRCVPDRARGAGAEGERGDKPIAAAISSAGVTDVLVAVVRYFGGTRLGSGGLARAYREAAEKALAAAGSKTVRRTVRVTVSCSFDRLGAARRLV